MFEKLGSLAKKYWGILSYLFFGVLTTLVNYAVYLPLYNVAHFSAGVSNAIAWAVAVLFAFLTNKPLVFGSHDWSLQTLLPELVTFTLCRVGSGALETGILLLFVDWLGWNGNGVKLATSVLVVIANYVSSKFLVFIRKSK